MATNEVGFGKVLEYGVRLTGVVLLLALLTGGLVALGVAVGGTALADEGSAGGGEAALAIAVFVIAVVVFYGGMFGIVYKVIADAVSEGIQMSGGIA